MELYRVNLRLLIEPGMKRNTNFTLSSGNALRDIIMCQLTGKGTRFDSRCLFLL
jgi:hypothetical protein